MSQYKLIIDSKPELKYIPLSNLYIPAKYQRALAGAASHHNIEHIKRSFNWAACGALLVCKLRKDAEKYAVIDGQHRFKGAELRDDITELPCVVISPRDLKEQAEIFINVNTYRQSLTPIQRYRASIVAQDPVSLLLSKICEDTGIQVPVYAMHISHIKADVLQSVGFLLNGLRRQEYTEKDLRFAFGVIQATYAGENGAMRASMVRALIEVSKKFDKMTVKEASGFLMGTTVKEIDLKARNLDIGDRGHKAFWKSYYRIIERYLTSKTKKTA